MASSSCTRIKRKESWELLQLGIVILSSKKRIQNYKLWRFRSLVKLKQSCFIKEMKERNVMIGNTGRTRYQSAPRPHPVLIPALPFLPGFSWLYLFLGARKAKRRERRAEPSNSLLVQYPPTSFPSPLPGAPLLPPHLMTPFTLEAGKAPPGATL